MATLSKSDSDKLHLSDFFKKDTYKKEKLTSFFNDVTQDFNNRDELLDDHKRTRKFQTLGGFFVLGAFFGHSYCAYRGVTRPSLYMRYVFGSSIIGLTCAGPVLSLPKISYKNYPVVYSSVIGGIWGGLIGFLHRGPQYMVSYAFLGVSVYMIALLFWYQIIKPVYYLHYLKWPDYTPPVWWPYQPVNALQIYDREVEKERLNVIFPEDIQFLKKFDKETDPNRRKREEARVEREFVRDTELEIQRQLDWIPRISGFPSLENRGSTIINPKPTLFQSDSEPQLNADSKQE